MAAMGAVDANNASDADACTACDADASVAPRVDDAFHTEGADAGADPWEGAHGASSTRCEGPVDSMCGENRPNAGLHSEAGSAQHAVTQDSTYCQKQFSQRENQRPPDYVCGPDGIWRFTDSGLGNDYLPRWDGVSVPISTYFREVDQWAENTLVKPQHQAFMLLSGLSGDALAARHDVQ